MPQELKQKIPVAITLLSYSNHAIHKLEYYGLKRLNSLEGEVIEIELSGSSIVKVLIRSQLSPGTDLSTVIGMLSPTEGFVKTLWTNSNDSHRTRLNRKRYIQTYGNEESSVYTL